MLLGIGTGLAVTAAALALGRPGVSEALVVTLLSFAAVFVGVPLPDILARRKDDEP